MATWDTSEKLMGSESGKRAQVLESAHMPAWHSINGSVGSAAWYSDEKTMKSDSGKHTSQAQSALMIAGLSSEKKTNITSYSISQNVAMAELTFQAICTAAQNTSIVQCCMS